MYITELLWTDKLKTGIDLVDLQHMEIIQRINRLTKACAGFKSNTWDETCKMLDFLAQYIIFHFADEEGLQQECRYPKYARHKREHISFYRHVIALHDDLKKDVSREDIIRKLNITIISWLMNHIQTSDVEFTQYYLHYKGLDLRTPRIIKRI